MDLSYAGEEEKLQAFQQQRGIRRCYDCEITNTFVLSVLSGKLDRLVRAETPEAK